MTKPNPIGSAENISQKLADLVAGRYEGYVTRQANLLYFAFAGYVGAPTREDCRQLMFLFAVKAAQKHNPERATFSTYLLDYLVWQRKSFRKDFFRRGRTGETKIVELSQIAREELRVTTPPDPSIPPEQETIVQIRELFASLSPTNKRTLQKLLDTAHGSLDEAARLIAFRNRGPFLREANVTTADFQRLRAEVLRKVGEYV